MKITQESIQALRTLALAVIVAGYIFKPSQSDPTENQATTARRLQQTTAIADKAPRSSAIAMAEKEKPSGQLDGFEMKCE